MSANLVIKSPSQQVEDQKFECQLSWSIEQLKEHISQVYPTKPRKEHQKLIYSGRLLPNNLKLADILHGNSEVYTLHLVCNQSSSSELKSTGKTPVSNSSSSNVTNATVPPSLPTSEPSVEGLRQRRNQFENIQSSSFHQVPPVYPGFPTAPSDMATQMALMQQAYQQYMSQYLTYVQSMGSPYFTGPYTNAAPVVESTPSSTPTPDGVPNRPANQNAGVEVQAPPPAAAAGARPNDDDDVGANGDMLDYFYVLSRVFILASILYMYSSFGRILLVSGLGILLYLYRNGRLARRRQRNDSHTAAANQADNTEHDDPNRTVDNSSRAPDNQPSGVPEASERQEQNANNEEEHNHEAHSSETANRSETSPVTAVWTFLTAFFSSLIPEQPIPVNIN